MSSLKVVIGRNLVLVFLAVFAGFFWPIITLAHYSQAFAAYYYGGMIILLSKVFIKIEDKVRRQLFSSLPHGLKILEVGPAKDGNLSFLPKGSVVTTLELNPLLQKEQEVIRKQYPDLVIDRMLIGNIEDAKSVLPEDNSFDVIIMTHVLCCVKNKEAAIKEMYRLLKKKGRLIFLDVVQYDKKTHPLFHSIQSLFVPLHRFVTLGCKGGSYDARDLLMRQGFDVSDMKYVLEDTHPLPYAYHFIGHAIKN